MKILANDGLSKEGIDALQHAGFKVITEGVSQDQLIAFINQNDIEVLLVRSATKVRQDVFDQCPGLKFVGRGGVGMDNIDVAYGRSKGVLVMNTPGASSISVAELVIGHCFSLARFLHQSNRYMPTQGVSEFKSLKKKYEAGIELRGKTLGIVGMGRIGQATAAYALGCGMKVVYVDRSKSEVAIPIQIAHLDPISVTLQASSLDDVLASSDFLTLHIPAQANGQAVIGQAELGKMKKGSFLINTARGGSVDEEALKVALRNGHLGGAALDVFVNEPTPDAELMTIDALALTPHIGAATAEAQDRVGLEMASIIIEHLSIKA
ncbi:MAG TPA: D-2-hydroxyacid dehydrogenase [Luteibaculaceae bacterium]|nr:D-2-hydroxyacid dehydrogenase [Luteibaculaceae bacterium]